MKSTDDSSCLYDNRNVPERLAAEFVNKTLWLSWNMDTFDSIMTDMCYDVMVWS